MLDQMADRQRAMDDARAAQETLARTLLAEQQAQENLDRSKVLIAAGLWEDATRLIIEAVATFEHRLDAMTGLRNTLSDIQRVNFATIDCFRAHKELIRIGVLTENAKLILYSSDFYLSTIRMMRENYNSRFFEDGEDCFTRDDLAFITGMAKLGVSEAAETLRFLRETQVEDPLLDDITRFCAHHPHVDVNVLQAEFDLSSYRAANALSQVEIGGLLINKSAGVYQGVFYEEPKGKANGKLFLLFFAGLLGGGLVLYLRHIL